MSELLRLSEKIREVGASISESERELARHPHSLSLQLNASSLASYQEELESQFEETARLAGVDVCRYRLFGTGISAAENVFSALVEFQKLFTLTYSTIRSGIKKSITSWGKEDEAATTFGFSHTFAGSVGVVLTLPNERLMFVGTKLDDAISAIFAMAKLATAESVREYSDQFGTAVVHELYKWCSLHADSDLGADIDWKRGSEVRSSLFIQPQELAALRNAIDKSGDEVTTKLELAGELHGADVDSRSFHFRSDDGRDIHGKFFNAIGKEQSVVLPARYRASITQKSSVVFSTHEEKTEYFLDDIRPLADV